MDLKPHILPSRTQHAQYIPGRKTPWPLLAPGYSVVGSAAAVTPGTVVPAEVGTIHGPQKTDVSAACSLPLANLTHYAGV